MAQILNLVLPSLTQELKNLCQVGNNAEQIQQFISSFDSNLRLFRHPLIDQ